MDSPERCLIYPSPLSVCFHCWEDQCCPFLNFTCFVSIPMEKFIIEKSAVWSDPNISSVLFGGTDCGTIVNYKICSENGKNASIQPLCLIFGHHSEITSLVSCHPLIYKSCVASLSTDGTLSLISVEDFTIIKNCESLFSENSRDLAPHESNNKLMLASQAFGTVEVADISNMTLILRISGFNSIITGVDSHRNLHTVSCADGSIAVFTIDPSCFDCLYNIGPRGDSFSQSLLSPNLTYLLVLTFDEWALYDSDVVLFSKKIQSPDDSFKSAKWVNDSMFYVATLSGRVEIWKVDMKTESQIFDRMKTSPGMFYSSSISENPPTEPKLIHNAPEDLKVIHDPPTLFYSLDGSDYSFTCPTTVTTEGFIIKSPRPSFLVLNNKGTTLECDLSSFFTSKVRCRCAIGDPIRHEARVTVEGDIFLDSTRIGLHKGANLLFSPPKANCFFSFSSDGSVKAWGEKFISSFHDLCEPVKDVTYIPSKEWLVVIGAMSAFSVISISKMSSILLCSGHNSPILEVIYSNGLLHSRCASSSIYTWNIDGQLVSKRKSKILKRIGQISEISSSLMSRSEPSLHEKSIKLNIPTFSRIVPLIMPNCQTFAIVLDVFDFLQAYNNYESLNIQKDPIYLPLILLWKCHIGEDRVNLINNMGLLASFKYAISGDNYTVTLPLSLKASKKEIFIPSVSPSSPMRSSSSTLPMIKSKNGGYSSKCSRSGSISNLNSPTGRNEIAFNYSPLLSAIHSIAPSAIAQCFVGVKNDENLSIISSDSQITTAFALPQAVKPSPPVLANYLLFPSPSLRAVVINVIEALMATLSEEESQKIIDMIEYNFPKWDVLLPFVFIHCQRFTLSKQFGKNCASHIFPVIFDTPESVDLLLNCFDKFSKYIDDFQAFYIKMVDAAISKKITYNKTAGFGISRPLEFFDVAVMTPYCPDFCEALFERWMNPERDVLLNFINHILSASRNGISINLNRIFEIIASKVSYFSSCESYLVFGSGQGEIIVFSLKTTLITWKQQITRHPISCLSISPSGDRFVVVVLEDDYTISWVSVSEDDTNEPFKIDIIEQLPYGIVISDFLWKNDAKVILQNMGKKMIEVTAPNVKFFQRFKKKKKKK